jgi:hypothetical protein
VPLQGDGTREDSSAIAQVGQAGDQAHAWVSERITDAARWLDSFFGTERHEEEVNRTQVRVRVDSTLEEGGKAGAEVRAQLRLSLPGTEDRLHLRFASNADDDLGVDTDPLDDTQRELLDSETDDSSVGAGYFLLDHLQSHAKLEAGLGFRGSEPVPRLTSRAQRPWDAAMV